MKAAIKFIIKWIVLVLLAISIGFAYFSPPETLISEDPAKQGDSQQQYVLGMYYLNTTYSSHYRCMNPRFSSVMCEVIDSIVYNNEIQSTVDRGIYWLRKSASSGSVDAKYKLALALQKSTDALSVSARNQKLFESKNLLEQLVKEGYAAANYQLGRYYLKGIGVDVNYERAIYYLKVATDKNYPEAASLLDAALKESKN